MFSAHFFVKTKSSLIKTNLFGLDRTDNRMEKPKL